MYLPHLRCRACGYGLPANVSYFKSDCRNRLVKILDLGVVPLANAFVKREDPRPGHYPLELMVCPQCTLGQLSVVVDPSVLYSRYAYVTSPSRTMDEHLLFLYDLLAFHQKLNTVLEIGSNDGRALLKFREFGVKNILGVDPAKNLVEEALKAGVPCWDGVFNDDAAIWASGQGHSIDLIMARHVFCHIDNWKSFFKSCELASNKDTIVCIEAPWAHNTIQKVEWDQVYHEHLSFLTLKGLMSVLSDTCFHIDSVHGVPIHGGAIVVVLRRNDHSDDRNPCVKEFVSEEKCEIEDWRRFATRAQENMINLRNLLEDMKKKGKRVAGYGASAKASTWISALKIPRDQIYGVYDSTLQKVYSTMPGTDIPVLHEGGFYVDNPDYAVCWAWNFMDEIKRKNQKWIDQGGKFILPVPEVKII